MGRVHIGDAGDGRCVPLDWRRTMGALTACRRGRGNTPPPLYKLLKIPKLRQSLRLM